MKGIIYVSGINGDVYCKEILGLTILERLILSLKKNGLNKVYLMVEDGVHNITNCMKGNIHTEVINLKDDISIADNSDFNPDDTVIILFGDKIYEPNFSKKIITLAKTGKTNSMFLMEITGGQGNVTTDKNGIGRVGAIIVKGKELGQIISLLKNNGNIMKTNLNLVPIREESWVNIVDDKSLKKAEKMMLNNLSKPGDGFISYHINRRVSTRITKRLVKTRVTPNQITLISFTLSIIAAYLFTFGTYFYTILAGVLTQFSSILDGCDGEIARLKFMQSPHGAFLDTIMDRYADIIITLGIFIGYINSTNQLWVWPLILIPFTGFTMSSYTRKEYQLRFGREPPDSILLKLIRRDLRLFAIFIGALIFKPLETVIFIGVLSNIVIGKILISSK